MKQDYTCGNGGRVSEPIVGSKNKAVGKPRVVNYELCLGIAASFFLLWLVLSIITPAMPWG